MGSIEKQKKTKPQSQELKRSLSKPIRVMTYNLHRCLGIDNRLSIVRIARVIKEYRPDIVALQELDMNRKRSGNVDQAHRIADYLEMEYHFHPSIHVKEEKFGNAILTKHPMMKVKAGAIPGPKMGKMLGRKPRGALWVKIKIKNTTFNVINTHFGLGRLERSRQVKELLGKKWLGNEECRSPIILCGDFNESLRGPACRLIQRGLKSAAPSRGEKKYCTFMSPLPLRQIDHIFISPELSVRTVLVPKRQWMRKASDHLPLIASINLKKESGKKSDFQG